MRGKGQTFSLEFITSYMVFMVALILGMYLWNSNIRGMTTAVNHRQLYDISVEASEKLVRTGGSPPDWDKVDVHSFGLANSSRILDPWKVLEFVYAINDTIDDGLCGSTNYECRKFVLVAGYDVWFNLTFLNDSTVSFNNTLLYSGRPPTNVTSMMHVTRNAIFDGEIVRMNLEVWE